jgi:hypothetical protein
MSGELIPEVKPKKSAIDNLLLFRCECGNIHFRHAGYVELLVPAIEADREKKVYNEHTPVKVCTKCKKSYVWCRGNMYDITEEVDIEAWMKTEKEMHKCTGPGGDC